MAGENDNTEVMQPDDGLSLEERAQFDSMRSEAPPPEPGEQVGAGAPPPEGSNAIEGAGDDDGGTDDESAGQQPGAKPPRRVSWSRFERETASRDKTIGELQAQVREREEKMARFDERMRIINEALAPKQQEQKQEGDEDPEPNQDEDIVGHAAWLGRELKRTQASLNELRAGREQEAVSATVQRAYEDDAHTYIAKEPNFPHAYNYLMSNRIAELAIYFFGKDVTEEGATLTPQELSRIRSTINAEERDLVAGALQNGQSPAQRIYSLARARGFRPPAPQQQPQNGKPNGKGAGAPGSLAAQAAQLDGKPGKANVSEEIARVKKGSEDALSLSQGAGAPALSLSPEQLASMPDDQFHALLDQLNPAELRRAMGG